MYISLVCTVRYAVQFMYLISLNSNKMEYRCTIYAVFVWNLIPSNVLICFFLKNLDKFFFQYIDCFKATYDSCRANQGNSSNLASRELFNLP